MKQEEDYQRMYLDALTKGIRKLKLISFMVGYQKFHDFADRINSGLNKIVSEMSMKDISTNCLGTLPILNKETELIRLQANYDLDVLRGFN